MPDLVRIISHWTAGAGRASALDLEHYHWLTEMDGTNVPGKEEPEDNLVTSDGDYAAHTLRLNTGSIGVACCGMRGAVESPFNPGPSPITEVQFEAHCKLIASLCHEYAITISDRTVLFHGEVQGTLGVRQRGKWDMNRLPFKPELRGPRACGDYLRERVRHYAGAAAPTAVSGHMGDRPTLYKGMRGSALVRDLQTMLKDLGYTIGSVDGHFGGITKRAVQAFQSDRGLVTDGAVGPLTWDALFRAMERGVVAEVPAARQNTSMADLRERGSSTIDRGDRAQVGTASALGAFGLGDTLTTLVSGVEDQVERATAIKDRVAVLAGDGFVANAMAWAANNWYFIVGGVLMLYALGQVQKAKESRLEDHRRGTNLGR